MRYLPISIDSRNKKVLIIGGGKVAYRKVLSLLRGEFAITVISKDFHEKFIKLYNENPNRLTLKMHKVTKENLKIDCDYLIIATYDIELNDYIETIAAMDKLTYLRVDTKSDSNFIMNKIITKGDISISISANGKNPTLTRVIAKDIDKILEENKVEE
ncbi:MAG: bifunctional precorrin-2 dehydrogenase/sirohydrochlorin ferrochelatase [Tissierellia bacterium]|nr:bifunctional precorrin-2 dehydrogenase/sirohydrochlorin ferrochelatase [Tissierellia bacterium]